jgi:hypothetical protein
LEILGIASADMKTLSAGTVPYPAKSRKTGVPVEGTPQTISGPDPAPNEEAKKFKKILDIYSTVTSE